jgi:hypothetical protein
MRRRREIDAMICKTSTVGMRAIFKMKIMSVDVRNTPSTVAILVISTLVYDHTITNVQILLFL